MAYNCQEDDDEIEESKEPARVSQKRGGAAATFDLEEQKVKQRIVVSDANFFCEPCSEGFTFKKPYEKHLRTAACKQRTTAYHEE